MEKRISVSGVLKDSWQNFSNNIGYIYYLFLPALALSLISSLVLFYTGSDMGPAAGPYFTEVFLPEDLPTIVLGIIGLILGALATISLLFFLRTGKKDTFASWKEYLRILPKYILVVILQVLMITAGFLLFVIPGIYLGVRYAFVGYRALEYPTQSIKDLFAAEARTTEGNRWTILAIGIIVGLTTVVLYSIFSIFAGFQYSALADFVFEVLVTPFLTMIGLVAYTQLTTNVTSEPVGEKQEEKQEGISDGASTDGIPGESPLGPKPATEPVV